MARRPLALALLAAALLAACHRGPELRAWRRFDLLSHEPAVEASPLRNPRSRPWRALTSFLGRAEVRDMTRVPPEQLAVFPQRCAGQVRALEQLAGSRLAWTVDLGAEPYLSLTVLGSPASCTYRVAVRAGGKEREILRAPAVPPGRFAPAVRELDLGSEAGRRVEIVLEVLGGGAGPPAAQWGSPAIYFRTPAAAPVSRSGPPNILLIGADTLRADVVGPRADGPSLTPELDRLAAESDVYPGAYTVINATNPSFASIFTGLYPKNHGVYDLRTPLVSGQATLAQRLQAAGYDTFAVIAARHLGDHNSGLGRGFGTIVQAEEHLAAEYAVESAMQWIGEAKLPFFAWVHLFDPHTPHTPPEPYALGRRPRRPFGLSPATAWLDFRSPGPREFDETVLAGNRDLYLGEVAYLDRQVGRLLDFLGSRGLLETTLVVFVADHGENLGEHGFRYRHVGLYETTTHVPLVVRRPGATRSGAAHDGLVETIDLFPTLLRAAGLMPPREQDGIALDELFASGRHGRRAAFSEHSTGLGAAVRDARWRYVENRGNHEIPDGATLFDLERDPGEQTNLAGRGLPAETRLAELLRLYRADRRPLPGKPTPRALGDEDRARLKALGYLQ